MNTLIALSPIVLLIYLMTKKKNLPSYVALPITAGLLYLLKLFYFESGLTELNANVIAGLLTAWTPILIIWGAIFLFKAMEYTGAMKVIHDWLQGITQNKVGQLMIIGWAFAFLIEGASGFGTPAAIAAPLLVSLGFSALPVAMLALVMNSVPVTFGAVGTPIWFGLGQLGLSEGQLIEVAMKSTIIHGFAALVIPILALRFVVNWKDIKENILFIYLSIFACVIPYIWLAQTSYEFPAILGGGIGLIISIILAKKGIGLKTEDKASDKTISALSVIKAGFPLWGTVVVLLITRIQELGLKSILNEIAVIRWNNILGTTVDFKHALLYIPSLIPFFLIGVISFWLYKNPLNNLRATWKDSWSRIKKPILALLAALVFVKLLLMDGDQAITIIIGESMANVTGQAWAFFAPFLGALGSFFSGSNTVSNLTFGGIQQSISQNLSLNLTTILAAQSVGGAMGNMVCINNIVAVCSVLGLHKKEGQIIKKTIWPMLVYGLIAGVVSVFI